MGTYALLVGVEKYDQPGWDVDGPCRNALDVAALLLDTDTPGDHIRVFLAPNSDRYGQEIDKLRKRGVEVTLDGTQLPIDTYCRQQLALERPADSTLLIYWSGHGVTSASRDRVFFCSDYTADDLQNRVLNCMHLLGRLRTSRYACFTNQLILADVCGVKATVPLNEVQTQPVPGGENQVAYFATPEGEYAKGSDGRGAFTGLALKVLREVSAWPSDPWLLVDTLERRLREYGGVGFRVGGQSKWRQLPDVIVGRNPTAGTSQFRAVLDLLRPLDIPEETLRRQYRATVDELFVPELNEAQGLTGMLRGLSTLRDDERTGLLQFLARLALPEAVPQDDDLKEQRVRAINEWLDGCGAPNTVRRLRAQLAVEAQQKVLCIEVRYDHVRDDVDAYTPHLLYTNMTRVPGRQSKAVLVDGWNAFEKGLQDLLTEFMVNGELANLVIHFLADPPLYNRPFHAIPCRPGGRPIGELTIVLVRYLHRVRFGDLKLQRRWKEQADALQRVEPSSLSWVKVALDDRLPSDRGLFFTAFLLKPNSGANMCKEENEQINRLLWRGAPFVYVAHAPPDGGDWDVLKAELTAMLKEVGTLDSLPDQFLNKRIEGSHARRASVVWDDPLRNPFALAEGITPG